MNVISAPQMQLQPARTAAGHAHLLPPASPESIEAAVAAIEAAVRIDLSAGTVEVGNARAQHRERRDLVRELGTLIYTHFHVGNHVDDGLSVHAGRDANYEADLADRLADRSIRRRLLVHEVTDDTVIVDYLGLRVAVPHTDVTFPHDDPRVAEVDIPLVSPALSPGFALARGPLSPPSDEPLLRVYCSASDRESATRTFLTALDVLASHTCWHAKVASQARLYPRSDAVTIYLPPDELHAVPRLLSAIEAQTGQPEPFAPQSLFTRLLGRTVSCAWEPQQRAVSFGQHRARIVAQLVVARAEGTWRAGDDERICTERGIDPHHLWRNLTSPDPKLLHRPMQATRASVARENHEKQRRYLMSKDELLGGVNEYAEVEELNTQVEEGDETPSTTIPCSAVASAILTNNLNC